jgi:holliday junction DNA helicase RuvA
MIGRLRGTVIESRPPHVLLEVGGVGYELNCPLPTCADLPARGHEAVLYTQLLVREDDQSLFGFGSSLERDLFRALIKVNGVGPKLALALLSTIRPDALRGIVEAGNADALTKVPGVGKKTAQRLIIDLKGGLDNLSTGPAMAAPAQAGAASPADDAIAALVALGYRPAEAQRLVASISRPEHNSEQLIRLALRGALP